MRFAAVVALAAVAVKAQSGPGNYSSSLNMTIDPNSVEDSTRASWCTGQSDSCNTLCDKDASTNDCDYVDLSYDCKCASNDSAPGLQYYVPTMPTFICKALFSQCIEQYANDADGQSACEDNIDSLCGTIDVSDADVGGGDDDDDDDDSDDNSSTSASAPSSSATGDSGDDNDNESSGDATSTNSDDFAAPTAGPQAVVALGALGIVAAFI